ncbi:phosphoribosylanthranilate isomerase [Edaphobacter dinghuensis]|uniref:N-(5'-phosphoribosyl)anthranilate isomerase n=1 Tax=Edaphobacter dinghuensis TaxID=1560005 RepID=A0A917M0M4_9BACT|nr:phosphoribosylanthranilate isomerase [Edaphobacter dinghuensis]GGG68949.1 N-(5'-phosphoribosyl)anthranilate isomerase [Edaphobacter dinghuensis]
MWIKICANTNLDDAQMAAELGADAVGFVFAPSRRRVTAKDVAQITPHLPTNVERIGVFDSLYAEEIAASVREAGLTAVQLHGGGELVLARRLNDLFEGKIGIIQTVHWSVDAGEESAKAVRQRLNAIQAGAVIERVLIDSKVGQATGGTGVSFDWAAAREVLQSGGSRLKMIVAGGLRPDNVAKAISELNPWGVDVASGVEKGPGRKDPEKLRTFIQNAQAAKSTHV